MGSANQLALDFKVSEYTISYIKSYKADILATLSTSYQEMKKTLYKSEYPQLKKKGYDWFLSQCARNCAISGAVF